MIVLEVTTFIGRFHPLFVHLPIGFIFLAILLEWWENFMKADSPSRLVPIAWFIGGIAAFAAAVCGWYLGDTGLYEEERIFLHRWLGIALVPISFLGWWIKSKPNRFPKILQNGFNVLLIVLLSVEGHKGGNLTHGDTYLTEFAPKPIQRIMVSEQKTDFGLPSNNPDSVIVYTDLIQPIFNAKCVACHNNKVKRGGLNMSHPDSLNLGGDGGQIVLPGNVEDSELFRRVTLPQKNIKFMPPTKTVLTYDEIRMLAWWIDQGGSFESVVGQLEVGESIQAVLMRNYGLNTLPRPWYEKVKMDPLDTLRLSVLVEEGFVVNTFGESNPLLDVGYSGADLTKEKLLYLKAAKNHITWLSLAGTNVEDDWLAILSDFKNLTRLELDKTAISDKGTAYLKNLSHLEVLNLYDTKVSNDVLPLLQQLPELKRVYLSRTKVTLDYAKVSLGEIEGLSLIIDENLKK